MDEASYEARKRPLESDLPEQIEVRVRRERRRRWTPVDKLRIVEEAFAPGAVAKRVAERHEISTGLLFTWRRQLMADASARFQPVHLIADPEVAAAAPSSGVARQLHSGRSTPPRPRPRPGGPPIGELSEHIAA